MALTKMIYVASAQFPREEIFGLKSQMRRCSVSVPSNIAEGQGRTTRGEFYQFLGQARGSLYELETQTLLASELGYLSVEQCESLIRESMRLGAYFERTHEIDRASGASQSLRLRSGFNGAHPQVVPIPKALPAVRALANFFNSCLCLVSATSCNRQLLTDNRQLTTANCQPSTSSSTHRSALALSLPGSMPARNHLRLSPCVTG